MLHPGKDAKLAESGSVDLPRQAPAALRFTVRASGGHFSISPNRLPVHVSMASCNVVSFQLAKKSAWNE